MKEIEQEIPASKNPSLHRHAGAVRSFWATNEDILATPLPPDVARQAEAARESVFRRIAEKTGIKLPPQEGETII